MLSIEEAKSFLENEICHDEIPAHIDINDMARVLIARCEDDFHYWVRDIARNFSCDVNRDDPNNPDWSDVADQIAELKKQNANGGEAK